MEKAKVVHYKSSAYYFRKELRASKTIPEAIVVTTTVLNELTQLRLWAHEKGIALPKDPHAPLTNITSRAAVVKEGLRIILELEKAKAAVRDAGLWPPKWTLSQSEAAAKRWAESGARSKAESARRRASSSAASGASAQHAKTEHPQ